jgi:hypothetical protein
MAWLTSFDVFWLTWPRFFWRGRVAGLLRDGVWRSARQKSSLSMAVPGSGVQPPPTTTTTPARPGGVVVRDGPVRWVHGRGAATA